MRGATGEWLASFLTNPQIAARLAEVSAKQLEEVEFSPYDSHPPMSSRCAVLDSLDDKAKTRDDRPGTSLLRNVPDLEKQLLVTCVDEDLGRSEPLHWVAVPERVWMEHWRREVMSQARALTGYTVSDIASLAADPDRIRQLMTFESRSLPNVEDQRATAIRLLAIALGVALYDDGWSVHGEVGEALRFVKFDIAIEPFSLLERLVSGCGAEWLEEIGKSSIALLPLQPRAAGTPFTR